MLRARSLGYSFNRTTACAERAWDVYDKRTGERIGVFQAWEGGSLSCHIYEPHVEEHSYVKDVLSDSYGWHAFGLGKRATVQNEANSRKTTGPVLLK